MHYNHSCPKRSVLWSSNHRVLKFDKGKLTNEYKQRQRAIHGHVQPVKKTIGSNGKAQYSGTAALKGTQLDPQLFHFLSKRLDSNYLGVFLEAKQ